MTKSSLAIRVLPVFLVACLFLLPVVFAQASAEVLSDDGQRIVLRYLIGEYSTETVTVEGLPYEAIRLDSEPVLHQVGAPALPQVNRSVIIPDDARLELRVLTATYDESFHSIAPSKGYLSRKIDPALVPYELGEVYGKDAFFPRAMASLRTPYIMRDHRGVVVEVTPFQYNPVTRILRAYSEITVELRVVGPGVVNVLHSEKNPRHPVRSFQDIYDTHFLNASMHGGRDPELDYAPIDEDGDMLIICHDAWMDNMTDFVNHKNGIGINTSIVKVSEVGNDAASIKSYIQDRYDSSNLAFVLLVGDSEQVATPIVNVGGENGAADPTYAQLAGADDYPDIMVGRFSARSAADVDTQVQRTIDYETLPATGEDWFKRGTGIASDQGGGGQGDEGQSDIEHEDEIRGWLLGDGYTLVDQIYDPGATDDEVHDALNAGRGIVNYTGHGSATSWGTTGFNVADVNALVNDDMLPFIVSVACNNGEFHHYDTCFGEAWLRATHDGAPTGAIGIYASSVSQSWSPPMEGQDEFNLLLTNTDRPYKSYGALCFAGSSSMMDDYGSGGVDMFETWIIFGDPSVQVVGAPAAASGLRVTPADGLAGQGNAGGPFSPASLEYTLENLDETAMDYEVTADVSWVTIDAATGTIPAGDSLSVVVSFNDTTRNLDHGQYQGILSFVNLDDHEGDTTRSVEVRVGGTILVEEWTLDQSAGWSTTGEWEYGTPTGQGGGYVFNPDPTSGATGSSVYGVNLAGNVSNTVGGPYYLTTGPIDLSGVTGSRLSFQRWLNMAAAPYASITVEISTDGSSWSTLWSAEKEVTDAEWTLQEFDISAVADEQPAFQLRWGYSVVQSIPLLGSGWNIDDIEISGTTGSARVILSVAPGQLDWNDLPGAQSYDVVRGDLGILASTGGDFSEATQECVADELEESGMDYTDTPEPGIAFFLLVRANSPEGAMTWQPLAGESQVGARDDEINSAASTCP